jgi:hypothetical protein
MKPAMPSEFPEAAANAERLLKLLHAAIKAFTAEFPYPSESEAQEAGFDNADAYAGSVILSGVMTAFVASASYFQCEKDNALKMLDIIWESQAQEETPTEPTLPFVN